MKKDVATTTFSARSLCKSVLIICCAFFSIAAYSQHDSLVLKNGNIIVGEIKALDKGVVTIETNYSKNDFTIEWLGIKEIYTTTHFLVTLKNGTRINGPFHSVGDNKIEITGADGKKTQTTIDNVVYLKGLKSDFWSRAYANIDLGFSMTKANSLRQYSMRSAVGYLADKWQVDLFYNDIRSNQDSVKEIKRTESGAAFKYFLPKDWYLSTSINTLSNTEQALKMRLTGKLGAGKYLLHSNKAYLGVGGGLSLNNETFTNTTPKRTSLEGYLGAEANLFDIGKLSLLSNLYVYPSFTESGRWRTDFGLDTKYDLPLNLYLKFGVTFNYDNRPAVVGKETDYVYAFSVGWKL